MFDKVTTLWVERPGVYPIPSDLPETVLEEAERLIHRDRNQSYGSAADDFGRTGKMWGAVLGIDPIPPRIVALMMVCLKVSRESHKHTRDSCVDGPGYFALAHELGEEER